MTTDREEVLPGYMRTRSLQTAHIIGITTTHVFGMDKCGQAGYGWRCMRFGFAACLQQTILFCCDNFGLAFVVCALLDEGCCALDNLIPAS